MKELLDVFAMNTRPLQIKLKDNSPPMAGVIETDLKIDGSCGLVEVPGVYVIHTKALVAGPGGRPAEVELDVYFTADSVLWATEGPSKEPQADIVVPGGNRTPGGLHIG